jgi:hypothetical protein
MHVQANAGWPSTLAGWSFDRNNLLHKVTRCFTIPSTKIQRILTGAPPPPSLALLRKLSAKEPCLSQSALACIEASAPWCLSSFGLRKRPSGVPLAFGGPESSFKGASGGIFFFSGPFSCTVLASSDACTNEGSALRFLVRSCCKPDPHEVRSVRSTCGARASCCLQSYSHNW